MKHRLEKHFACLLRLIVITAMLLACCGLALAEGSISGNAFLDRNRNGVQDGDESRLGGVPVALEKAAGEGWEQIAMTSTDSEGAYLFGNLENGEYRVASLLQNNQYAETAIGGEAVWENGFVHGPVLQVNGDVTGQDITVELVGRVTVFAYNDANNDGEKAAGEKALAGVTVEAVRDGQAVACATTGDDGRATLMVPAGGFSLRVTAPKMYGVQKIGGDMSVNGYAQTAVGSEVYQVESEGELSLTVSARPVGLMGGHAFEDTNNNGVWDDGEPGVPGVQVHLESKKGTVTLDTVTDEDGYYLFVLPGDGRYIISATLPEGMLYARYSKVGGDKRSIFTGSTVTREFSSKRGNVQTELNIGTIQRGAICGTAFLDLNYDGQWDEDEPVYAGVTVEAIKLSSGDSYGKTVTGPDGTYQLENLRGGEYRLRVILPDNGSLFSMVAEGEPSQVNRFEQKGTRRESNLQPLTIESGDQLTVLIGVAQGASFTGKVFHDKDYSGVMGGGEKAMSGLKVQAVDEDGTVVAEDTTGKSGSYELKGILPGTYVIRFQRRIGYGFTRCRAGQSSGSWVTTIEDDWGVCEPVTVAMGETVSDLNAGLLAAASVSGRLYHDANDNGTRERSETGVPGTSVHLWSEEAEMDFVCEVEDDGSFSVTGVMPGTYNLEYILPDHCEMAGSTPRVQEKAVTVKTGDAVELKEAGAVMLGSYEGYAYLAYDGEEHGDDSEPVAGAKLIFTPSGNPKAETVTAESDENGAFSVTGLRPADYTISVSLPDGLIFACELDDDGLTWPAASEASQPCDWITLSDHSEKAVMTIYPASISGQVWMDENRSGYQDQGEWIMEDLTVSLVDEISMETVASSVTDETGYHFDTVRPGCYTVQFRLPEQATPAEDVLSCFGAVEENGNTLMCAYGIQMNSGEEIQGLNVGLVSRTSLGGTVRVDENGRRSTVDGAEVVLLQNGSAIASMKTGNDGAYRFDGLWPDDYVLRVTLPDGAIFIREGDANYASGETVVLDSGKDAVSESDAIPLKMAQHQLELDVLCIKPAIVGDLAWLDENGNGLVDGQERRIPGITVRLTQNGETMYETTTDAFGYYKFGNVYPGTYVLEADAYDALDITRQVPSLRIISSCLTDGDGSCARSDPFDVISGSVNKNMDLGYLLRSGASLPEELRKDPPAKNWSNGETIR